MKQWSDQVYNKKVLTGMESVNTDILKVFQSMDPQAYTKRTHYFHGRYENIYIDEMRIAPLKLLIDRIKDEIGKFLQADVLQIRMGFWMNAMMPGHMTTRHSHDDLDEVLSGVYYVHVPPLSGNLVLYNEEQIEIEPRESMLIFFSPALEHEVLINKSADIRLSIGFNASLLPDN